MFGSKNKVPRYKSKKYKHEVQYNLEDFIKLIEFGDITDCYVTISNEVFNTGKSADYTNKKGFFDYEYYVDKVIYTKQSEYVDHLRKLLSIEEFPVKKIFVHEIDGGKPYDINKRNSVF